MISAEIGQIQGAMMSLKVYFTTLHYLWKLSLNTEMTSEVFQLLFEFIKVQINEILDIGNLSSLWFVMSVWEIKMSHGENDMT